MREGMGLWMYCIIENEGEMKWDCLGIHGTSPVFTVAEGGMAAVVSEEPLKKYPLMRDFLMAHQIVNEKVSKSHRVLPVKFCTIAESEEKIVREVLQPKGVEFRQKLSEIADKEEYGLRVRWKNLDHAFQEIGTHDERIRKEKEEILSLPEEKRRAALIDIGHLVQEAILHKNEGVAGMILEALSPLACEVKKNKTLGDAMILNAAFLVKKSKQEAFDRVMESLDAKYGTDLHFKYVGPVPPFNFVEIVIDWTSPTTLLKPEGEKGRSESDKKTGELGNVSAR